MGKEYLDPRWRFEIFLYFKKDAGYNSRIDAIQTMLRELEKKWGVTYHLVESTNLSEAEVEKLKVHLRSISPQVRGKIVSSKRYILPLSGSKNLNLDNTPILILFQNNFPVNVFPHLLGKTYFEVESFLEKIIQFGPQEYLGAKGLLEDPIQKILGDDPSILENGMKFIGTNVTTRTGVIDSLLTDGEGRSVVVEVETHANDFSIGQVCRLAAGYSEKTGIPLEKIRKAIVCLGFDENLIEASKGANVELYKVTFSLISKGSKA